MQLYQLRVLTLLLTISLSVAHGQETPALSEPVKTDLEEFSNAYYPSLRVEYLKLWGSRGIAFEYWDQDNPAHSCSAMYFGSSRKALLVSCVELGTGTWRPPVHYYAFTKQGDVLVDSKRDIFPMPEIFDQLQGFVVDSKKAESLLSDETENSALYDLIEFEWGEDDILLVSIRSIEGVIEGAPYASMVWDDKQNRFVVDN